MRTITELLNLYEDFFGKLNAKLTTDPKDPVVRSEKFENPTDAEIDAFAREFDAYIPDDIRLFWKSLKRVHEALVYDETEWVAGRDFISMKYIVRDTPQLRNLAKNYPDDDPIKKLHEKGVQLTYEEPVFLFDADIKTKTGNIHQLLWDGEPIPDAIAPDFTTFFEHWLAAGCFFNGDFNTYREIVKDIVPVHIPEKDNLWLQFYNKQYKSVDEEAQKAAEEREAENNAAYEQGREGIALWRDGEEKEAAKLFEKVIEFGLKDGDEYLVTETICNYSLLCGEAGRPDESMQVLSNFFKEHEEIAYKNPRPLSLYGQYHYERGKLDEAYELCKKAIEKGPMFGLGYYTLACACIRLKKFDEALENVIKAAKFDKDLIEELAADSDFEAIKDRSEFKKALGLGKGEMEFYLLYFHL